MQQILIAESRLNIRRFVGAVVCFLIFTSVAALPTLAETLTGIASVIDGDTIEIHGQRVRLLDMDAPETKQLCKDAAGVDYRCGQSAALAMSDYLQQRTVTCDWAKRDKYKRLLGRCVAGGEDIGLWLVRRGLAVPYRDCKCEIYREAALQAKEGQKGIWVGAFQMPWEWRKVH